jgi:hypothetical protein
VKPFLKLLKIYDCKNTRPCICRSVEAGEQRGLLTDSQVLERGKNGRLVLGLGRLSAWRLPRGRALRYHSREEEAFARG